MRVFSEQAIYHAPDRYHTNNIIKSLWNDSTQEGRRELYGNWVDLFEYEPRLSRADVCLLTYQWPYYVNNDRVADAEAEVKVAKEAGKPMVVFSGGDYPARTPFSDVILFESAGYRSDPGYRYHSATPAFIGDYLEEYCGGELLVREKQAQPAVGFCGQASLSPIQTAYRTFRLKWQQHQYRQGKTKWEPAPFETSSFRSRVLKEFEGKDGIQTNYLLRSQYHGGDKNDKDLQARLKTDFVNNILNSDYTVCMRGGGNFSVRFYETLCLGRIPIFIDTDCLLPFQDAIEYKAIFPWIDMKDLPDASEILLDFHSRLSAEDFKNLQVTCRNLWIEHMTADGFFRDLSCKLVGL